MVLCLRRVESWRKADKAQPPVNELTAKKCHVCSLPGMLTSVKMKIVHLQKKKNWGFVTASVRDD